MDSHLKTFSEKDLRASLAQRNEFICTASHELKTPLAALMLQMEMAKRAPFITPEKMSRIIDNTHKDVLRLKRLVDDMLDVSRIVSGKLSMEFEIFQLDEFMQELIERLSPAFNQAGKIKLILNAPVQVNWDRFRIEQVVTNLLTNACRYGEGAVVEIETTCHQESASLVVRDFGIGIAEENLSKIFELFERGPHPTESTGMGLGLFICQEIINHHQGKIRVESTPGLGSTFTVDIPFHRLNNPV